MSNMQVFMSSGRFSSTSGRLPVLISFQVPRKGRSINRLDDVVSPPEARLLKARIAIQISPSGRLTAVVRTRVHQRRKLPILLQPSERLPIMVRTLESLIRKLLAADDVPSRPDEALKQERFPHKIFRKSCSTVVRPDGPQVYFA
jgi:hypothetical protein